jgi:hypothetical protein
MGLKPFNHLRDFLKKNPNPKRAKVFRWKSNAPLGPPLGGPGSRDAVWTPSTTELLKSAASLGGQTWLRFQMSKSNFDPLTSFAMRLGHLHQWPCACRSRTRHCLRRASWPKQGPRPWCWSCRGRTDWSHPRWRSSLQLLRAERRIKPNIEKTEPLEVI